MKAAGESESSGWLFWTAPRVAAAAIRLGLGVWLSAAVGMAQEPASAVAAEPSSAAPVAEAPVAVAADAAAGRAAEAPTVEATLALLREFQVIGRADGYLGPDEFVVFLEKVEAGRGMEKDALARAFDEKRGWLAALLILALGLALNLTPCVLPMIPVNLAIIGAGSVAGSRRRGLALGGLYGAGMALAYGGLGLLVALGLAQFGTLNAHPAFNFAVAGVFLVLALAMFGVFHLDLTRFQSRLAVGRAARGRLLTAFFMGGVTALLAGACVAPVLISVLTISARLYADGRTLGLFLPFLLGLAMALPWPLAGAGLSFLPKPGRWMVGVKIAFGVIILGAALGYGYEGWRLYRVRRAAAAPMSMRAPTDAARDGVSAKNAGVAWFENMAEALRAAREQGRPLYVDCWATWCISCRRMQRTTFQDTRVAAKLAPYIALKFQAEDLQDPAIAPLLDAMGVTMGLPAHVVLKPLRP
jgi:thioredoxin:protein disulfide reductase